MDWQRTGRRPGPRRAVVGAAAAFRGGARIPLAAVSGGVGQRTTEVIVIGGGVAGLAAAGALGRRGIAVTLLEARHRLGGRVLTGRRRGWTIPVEFGPQFIHGGNNALWRLIRSHRIRTAPVPSRHWHSDADDVTVVDATRLIATVTEGIDERRMTGWSFADYLRERGSTFTPTERALALGFVEGFEAAPADKMSAVAVAGETLEDDDQYFIPGGYNQVVSALVAELPRESVSLILDAPCSLITWRPGRVQVRAGRFEASARALIVTAPVGVLQARASVPGAIGFDPALPGGRKRFHAVGVGHVVRITLRLDGRRWPGILPEVLAGSNGFGFIHSAATVPVWWSLTPGPYVTGWVGGPAAQRLSGRSDTAVVRSAVSALAAVMHVRSAELDAAVLDVALHDWSHDPFSRGAYSFTRAGHDDASVRLREPVRDTLFFAGEATASGAEVGTVHGALASGNRAACEVATVLPTR